MVTRVFTLLLVGLTITLAHAQDWSRARLSKLPDSAFAVIETASNGKKVRHLPHHDERGAVDPLHLKAARARLGQVKWIDPTNEAVARRHLEEHGHAASANSGGSVRGVIEMRHPR